MQIVVKLTNRCNLRCKYCSEGNICSYADISSDVFNKLVDDLPMVLDFIGDKDVDFLWHGGEPLCYNKVTLCKMMDYAKDKLGTDYKVSFRLRVMVRLSIMNGLISLRNMIFPWAFL